MSFATLHLDTYKVVKLLQSKGYTKEEAEGFIEAIQEVTLSGVATKQDIADLKEEISKLEGNISTLDAKTDKKIDNLKIWFLGAMLTQTVALVALFLSL